MVIPAGTRLGPYEILTPLGAGGMGEVYRARDARLGREVAVKVLPERLAGDPRALSRFEREARAVAALSHPNILAIHDFGEEQGVRYAITELLEGQTLRERLARERLSWRKAAEIGVAIADGLSAAHMRSIVHRDLKPENIFLTTGGHVKILDFGLARADAGPLEHVTAAPTASAATEAGTVLGTLGYMSPEQVSGSPADARSDIFSLGCVLYEMLTGRRAFSGESPGQTMAAILRDQPAEVTVSGTEVPEGVDRIVRRCLEKGPGERFQSAGDLSFALKESLGSGLSKSAPKQPALSRRTGSLLVGAAIALIAVLLIFRYLGRSAGPGRIESLAVLPLANLSGDPQQEYFADGMTEELITALAKVSALRVVSRTSAMRYKSSTKALPEIAKELGVDAIVEGSVTRSGSQVKITAQLIDAPRDRHLWADSFQRDLKDVLALQGEVARAIAGEIGVRLTPQERSRLTEKKTVNPEAYEAYLKGNYHLFRRTATDAQKSLEYFQQAVEKQPGYALAYAGMAEAYESAAGSAQGALSPKEAFPKAKAAAMRAAELDSTLGEPYVSLAWSSFVFDRDWTTAENQFQRALRLSPNYSTAHENYATFLSRMGRFDEALREAKRAQELDPLSLSVNTMMGINLGLARRDDEAIPWFRRVLDMDPNFLRAHFGLGLSLVHKKRYDEAITELQKAVELSGGGAAQLGALGYAYAVANRRAEALEIVERLNERSREHYVPPAMVATVFSGLGDKDQAMAWLEKAIEEHDPWLTGLKVDPMFDSLRSDPRFLDLLHRVGLD
jgi:serine/threonine protein kinase/tetratricopeptide (TPR) repeat protein